MPAFEQTPDSAATRSCQSTIPDNQLGWLLHLVILI